MEAHQASLSFTIFLSLLNLMSVQSVMPSNHLILYCPLLLLSSIFPSIRVFSNELALCIRWPKYWGFSFSISPFNEYSELISFRIHWFDLLAVQGTLSLLQEHSSKISVFWHSAFSMGQLSHSYLIAGNTIALTIWTFVGKVMSLLLNVLSSFVSSSSKEQASFNFIATVTTRSDLRAQENKTCHCFHFFLLHLPWSNGTGCHDLSLLNIEF